MRGTFQEQSQIFPYVERKEWHSIGIFPVLQRMLLMMLSKDPVGRIVNFAGFKEFYGIGYKNMAMGILPPGHLLPGFFCIPANLPPDLLPPDFLHPGDFCLPQKKELLHPRDFCLPVLLPPMPFCLPALLPPGDICLPRKFASRGHLPHRVICQPGTFASRGLLPPN